MCRLLGPPPPSTYSELTALLGPPPPSTYSELTATIRDRGSRIPLPADDVRLFEADFSLDAAVKIFIVGHVRPHRPAPTVSFALSLTLYFAPVVPSLLDGLAGSLVRWLSDWLTVIECLIAAFAGCVGAGRVHVPARGSVGAGAIRSVGARLHG